MEEEKLVNVLFVLGVIGGVVGYLWMQVDNSIIDFLFFLIGVAVIFVVLMLVYKIK